MDSNKINYLATIPKSGTNMLHYFFYYYDNGICNNDLDHDEAIKNKPAPYLDLIDSKLGKFLIGHGYCCGFKKQDGKITNSWENLSINKGFIPLEESIHTLKKFLDPYHNKFLKIGFVYRNPFDQLVSMYKYIDMLYKIKELYNIELDSYIKVYYTFKVMKSMFPDKIKFFKYEDIMRNRREALLNMIDFFQPEDNYFNNESFEKALHLTSKNEIQKMEKRSGFLLSGKRVVGTEHRASHITDGKIGKWKSCEYISDDVISYLHQRFHEFDINTSDFIWE